MAKPGLPRPNFNYGKTVIQRMPGSTAQGAGISDELLEFAPDYVRSGFASQTQAAGQREQAKENLKAQGFRVQGNLATRNQAGIPFQYPVDSLLGSGPSNGAFDNIPPVLLNALFGDTRAMQEAADQQYGRNDLAAGLFRDATDQGARDIADGGRGAVGRLQSLAGTLGREGESDYTRLEDLIAGTSGRVADAAARGRAGLAGASRDVDRATQFAFDQVKGTNQKVDGDIEEAYALGNEAVAKWEQDIAQFKDTTAADASAISQAIYRDAESQIRDLRGASGRADGRLNNEQIMAAESQIKMRAGQQAQQAITPLFSRFNEAFANLKQAVAQMRLANANMRLEGAGLRQRGSELALGAAQVGMDGAKTKAGIEEAKFGMERDAAAAQFQEADALAQAQQGKRDYYAMVSNLVTAAEQVGQAAILDTARLRLEGYNNFAAMIERNSRSVVSWFQGLFALYSASQTMAPEPAFSPSDSSDRNKPSSPAPQAPAPQGNARPRRRESVNNLGLTGYGSGSKNKGFNKDFGKGPPTGGTPKASKKPTQQVPASRRGPEA